MIDRFLEKIGPVKSAILFVIVYTLANSLTYYFGGS